MQGRDSTSCCCPRRWRGAAAGPLLASPGSGGEGAAAGRLLAPHPRPCGCLNRPRWHRWSGGHHPRSRDGHLRPSPLHHPRSQSRSRRVSPRGKRPCRGHGGGFGALWGCCAPRCAQLARGAADSAGKGRMRGNDAADFTVGLVVMLLVVDSSANPLPGLQVQGGILCSAPWGGSARYSLCLWTPKFNDVCPKLGMLIQRVINVRTVEAPTAPPWQGRCKDAP